MVNITIQNPIFSTIPKLEISEVLDIISYKYEYWLEGRFHKEKSIYYKQALFDKNSNPVKIYTGHIPRIIKELKELNIETKVHGEIPKLKKQKEIYLKQRPEINFQELREFQRDIIESIIKVGRGVIESPTGTGKTAMQAGLMSAFPDAKILLLCHTVGIIKQTAKELIAWDFKNIQIIGAGEGTTSPKEKICLSTVQSFAKLNPETYAEFYDIIIVDEMHRVSSFQGQYATILNNCYAPLRVGFTATLPKKEESVLAYEAFLGEKIKVMHYQDTEKMGITAKPKIKIIKLPLQDSLRSIRNYRDLYGLGVTHNDIRNNKIVDIIEQQVNLNESILIFVTEIVHGKRIQEIFNKRYKTLLPFVNSEMPVNEREEIKNKLNSKELPYCLATSSWREGINIPELNNILIGGIGKSEIALLQGVGRGNRKTSNKNSFKLWLLFDESNYHLVNHFGNTISILSEKDWL